MNRLLRHVTLGAILELCIHVVSAQPGSLILTSSAASAGTGVSLSLFLNSAAGSDPAAIQWTFTYSPAVLSAISAIAGPVATAAGKSINCAPHSGAYTCILAGMNANVLASGIVATLNATLSTSAAGFIPIGVTNTLGASPGGNPLSLSGVGGTLTVSPGPATLVATPASLTIASPSNGPPITQAANLTSSDPSTALTLQKVSDDGVSWARLQWFGTGGPTGTPATPGQISVTVAPTGLAAGPHTDNIVLTSNANTPLLIPVTLTIQPPAVQTIPRVVDGVGARTSITLVNHDTAPANYSMQFYDPSGTPLNINLAAGSSSLAGSIPVGGVATILTAGQASPPIAGWGLLTTQNQIAGFGVYQQTETGKPTQEAGMPLNLGGLRHFLLPFDNSNGFSTSLAITNISGSQTANATAIVHDSSGNVLNQGSLAIAANGQASFATASQFPGSANIRGVLELTSDQDVSAVAFRFNPTGSFTSFDVLPLASPPAVPTEASIARVADGGGFAQSQIILVNSDTVPAAYGLSFYDAGGNALNIPLAAGSASLSGTIPVGGLATITTSGNGTTVAGWAQLTTQNSISGFGVISQTESGIPTQEATMPLNAGGTRHFLAPFDNTTGFVSSLAITNLSGSQASITATVRDSLGNILSQPPMNRVAPYGQTSFSILDQFANTANIRGVLEFITDQDVSVVALRFAATRAFTSFRVVPLN